ncbi:hypothetical protein [Janthinobacterium sp. RB2P8]|uniref:hypothetical protein n=1 Tax=Janthinobacterium sp. RB2P8 TaxID=3424191 RepID=UPI003F223581
MPSSPALSQWCCLQDIICEPVFFLLACGASYMLLGDHPATALSIARQTAWRHRRHDGRWRERRSCAESGARWHGHGCARHGRRLFASLRKVIVWIVVVRVPIAGPSFLPVLLALLWHARLSGQSDEAARAAVFMVLPYPRWPGSMPAYPYVGWGAAAAVSLLLCCLVAAAILA